VWPRCGLSVGSVAEPVCSCGPLLSCPKSLGRSVRPGHTPTDGVYAGASRGAGAVSPLTFEQREQLWQARSMRLARLARIVWAASRGYVPMPRIEDED
jgi:hypothetical protein